MGAMSEILVQRTRNVSRSHLAYSDRRIYQTRICALSDSVRMHIFAGGFYLFFSSGGEQIENGDEELSEKLEIFAQDSVGQIRMIPIFVERVYFCNELFLHS